MNNSISIERYNSPGIYEIKCLVNKKVYIGSTIQMAKRYREHRNSLKANNHYNVRLQRAYNKHGVNNFIFNVICYCELVNPTKKELSVWLMEAENAAIINAQSANRNFGYNLASFERSNKGNLTCRFPRECRQGERNHNSTLTNEIVLQIVQLYNEGASYNDLSVRFNVKHHRLYSIMRGASWSAVTGIKPHKVGIRKGEDSPSAKLNTETVRKVLELLEQGCKPRAIANQLSISYALISGIRRGKAWKSVTQINADDVKRKPLLTDDQLLKIKKMLKRGDSCSQIARLFDVYINLISLVKRGIYGADITGLKPGQLPVKKILTPVEKMEIINLLKSGEGVIDLAKQFGTTPKVISKIKKEIPTNEVSKQKGALTPNQRSEVLILLKQGVGVTEIGRRFNVSHSTITSFKNRALLSA